METTDASRGDLVICGIRLHEGRLTLPRRVLRRYRAIFDQALAFAPEDLPRAEKERIRGVLGYLTMVTDRCPGLLVRPLHRLVRHHGSWLRPRLAGSTSGFPVYGL